MKKFVFISFIIAVIGIFSFNRAWAQPGGNTFSIKTFKTSRGTFPATTLMPGTQKVGQPINGLTLNMGTYRYAWRISIQSDGLKHRTANYYITKIYADPEGTITGGSGRKPQLITGARRINSEYVFIIADNYRGYITYTPSLSDGLYIEINGNDDLIAGQYEGTVVYSLYLDF